MARRFLTCLLIWWIAAGCARPQAVRDWEVDLRTAEQHLNYDRHDQADAAYRALLATAPTAKDARYARYMLGVVAEHDDRPGDAYDHYLAVFEEWSRYGSDDEYAARAIYRLGWIYYDTLHDRREAVALWQVLVRNLPDMDGPAHRAIDALTYHYETTGSHEQAVQFFTQAFTELEDTRLGDNMLYWLAYWLRHHTGDVEQAEALFWRLREQYYDWSGLRDQGEWQLVDILHEQGRFGEELALLHEMRREFSAEILFGPYANGSMEQAAIRMGYVYRDDLGDPVSAIREWRDFLSIWRLSLERDNVMYSIVEATVQLGQRDAIAEVTEEFILGYPESRFQDEVAAIRAEHLGPGSAIQPPEVAP